MNRQCPYCGGEIISDRSNFCAYCGSQLRELPLEDAALVPPEAQRQIPMPVIMKAAPIGMDIFVLQFGPACKGSGYLRKMITKFLVSGLSIEEVNCNELLKEACAKEGVKLSSAKRAIQRFIDKGWAQDFQSQWKKYAGWSEQQPPNVDAAMRLLLQLYVTQQKSMEKNNEKNRT